jgi:hypothetical protein
MKRNNQSGVALLSAILVLMLMSAILVGFVALVTADQAASGINRDQTQAYAAAHAGVEKLTADLGQLFNANFSPTGAQVGALTATPPVLPGIQYVGPNATAGYRITFTDTNNDGNPDVENPNGSLISAGPYQGLMGLITPYQIEVTARTIGNAEVRMRRTMQTIGIPVFQFGIFSENDQSFFAGPNFAFGGRIHTNQNLWLKHDTGNTLTIQDRVTAVGEVIRTNLANGQATHTGTVRMALASGCPAAPTAANASCRNLAATEGSLVGTVGSAQNEPAWTNLSMGSYGGWIRNGRTGATRLDLPIVSDGAVPIDLVVRPQAGEAVTSAIGRQRFYNMATLRILISDRAADITGLPGVVTTANVSPVRLAGTFTPVNPGANGNLIAGAHPFASSTAVTNDGFRTTAGTPSIDGYILINRQDRLGNWTDVTTDVLSLGWSGRRLSSNLGANPWTGNLDTVDLNNECPNAHPNAVIRLQRIRDTFAGRFNVPATGAGHNGCGAHALALNSPTITATDYWPNVLYDPREGMLRDDENARPVVPGAAGALIAGTTLRGGEQRMYFGGVMHYVELDVNNLRRYLRGDIGSTPNNVVGCANGAGANTCPMDTTGFVVYFSDRRGNHDLGPGNAVDPATYDPGLVWPNAGVSFVDDRETGQFGFEDTINLTAASTPNNLLDHPFVDVQGNPRWSEDVNQNGTLETYGQWPRLVFNTAAAAPAAYHMLTVAANHTPAGNPFTVANGNILTTNTYNLYATPIDRTVARLNRAFFFRRALKLVNGGRGNLPANGTQGLTVASETPVYIEGNYNACTNAASNQGNTFAPACVGGVGFGTVPAVDHVSAAVIADSVTFLSNAWNDIRSFLNPHDAGLGALGRAADGCAANAGGCDAQSRPWARQATTTWYRLGIISGKGLNFPRANVNPTARDHTDFGTDGGAHNFLRFIENWGGAVLNYRGSLISFYTSRQGVGTYKCCSIVYGAPTRGYNFDAEFLNPNLLPPRTPMFRDINTLTFRQILRPTQ